MVAELIPTVGYHTSTCAPTRIRDSPISLTFCGLLVLVFSQLAMLRERVDRSVWHFLAFAGHSPTLSERWVWARKEEEGCTANRIGGKVKDKIAF
jgi:hypothetical protein